MVHRCRFKGLRNLIWIKSIKETSKKKKKNTGRVWTTLSSVGYPNLGFGAEIQNCKECVIESQQEIISNVIQVPGSVCWCVQPQVCSTLSFLLVFGVFFLFCFANDQNIS